MPGMSTTTGHSGLPASFWPASFWDAAYRGVRCKCPRCGEGRVFRKWLKPLERCPACTLDLTPQRADDFPAYIAILVTGHLLAPLIIILSLDFEMEPLAMMSILVPLSLVMMLGMLQPSKGAVIAAQWWFGLHGFVKERRPEDSASDAA